MTSASASWCMNETKTTITERQSFHLVKVETLFQRFLKVSSFPVKHHERLPLLLGFGLLYIVEQRGIGSRVLNKIKSSVSHISFQIQFYIKQQRSFHNFLNLLKNWRRYYPKPNVIASIVLLKIICGILQATHFQIGRYQRYLHPRRYLQQVLG